MLPDVVAKNGFSLERLATLCAVIEAGSITAAAGPNTSRQSQFSRQIKELEEALGATLFDRIGKTLRPTPCGVQLARMSKSFFGAVADMAAREAGKPEQLVVGGGEAMLRWVVIPCLAALRDLDPPIHCQVRSLRTEEIVREVELGRIHVGLVRKTAVGAGLAQETIGTLEFALVIPRHLLRTRAADEIFEGRPLAYAELAGDGQLKTLARGLAKEAGIRLNRVLEAETLSLLLAAVEHGDAAAFLPAAGISALPSDRFAIPQVENMERLNREMVLIWLPEAANQDSALKRALRALVRSLTQAMADVAGSPAMRRTGLR
jgi:DNA-binding transcriptional LysR family regulator